MAKDKNISQKKTRKNFRFNIVYNKWLVKNIPFYLFASFLAVLYIANGHYADKTIRNINSTSKHLKEMEYEYKTVERDVIFRSKESELARAVEPLGLKGLMQPPVRLSDTIYRK